MTVSLRIVLQQAMDNASLAVKAYLRNLEASMLRVEDVPTLLFDGKKAEPEKPED